MNKRRPECRSNAAVERQIHAYAKRPGIELAYTDHAKARMNERGISGADILHALQHGCISDEPEPAERPGYYKYKICAKTPNSGGRTICLIVIPSTGKAAIKIVTVMWEDLK